jgi:hypothetical protein
MPELSVFQPPDNLVVKVNQPFLVTGKAFDVGPPEPNLIDSVTVSIDGGPAVPAALTRLPDKKLSVVSFKASAQVTGGPDPHTVIVIATNDIGRSVKKSVSIFTKVAFEIAAPAVVIEIGPFLADATDPDVKRGLQNLTLDIQDQLEPLSVQLASIGQVLAGPGLLVAVNPDGIPVLRIGLWVVDSTFPLVPPKGDFVLPLVPDPGVTGGFALAPFTTLPPFNTLGPSFAVSIPVTSLQDLLDVATPGLNATASQNGASIDALTVQTSSPGSVTLSVVGKLESVIPFTFTVTEVLGRRLIHPRHVPAVIGTSHSASAGDVLDWLIDYLVFGLSGVLSFLGVVHVAGGQAASTVSGIVTPLVAAIPQRIPFRSSLLPAAVAGPHDFPAAVPDWAIFEATDSAIVGTGTTTIVERNQSQVGLSLSGPTTIRGYQGDLSGGAGQVYHFSLTDLVPDGKVVHWQVSGTGAAHGSVGVPAFGQEGRLAVEFPLPIGVKPGTYPFTLTVNAAETSGTDAAKTLSASASLAVHVEVVKPKEAP